MKRIEIIGSLILLGLMVAGLHLLPAPAPPPPAPVICDVPGGGPVSGPQRPK